MNVFVLGTGRCGTVTFIRACQYITNYSSGHETRSAAIGADRFDYPDDHIEADNRLSWFLGRLGRHYDDREVLYVHLRRDREATAASFLKRWDGPQRAGIMRAYRQGIIPKGSEWPERQRFHVCLDYVDTVTANIIDFLHDRTHLTLHLEDIEPGFTGFLDRIGADGDLAAARDEWNNRHNSSLASRLGRRASEFESALVMLEVPWFPIGKFLAPALSDRTLFGPVVVVEHHDGVVAQAVVQHGNCGEPGALPHGRGRTVDDQKIERACRYPAQVVPRPGLVVELHLGQRRMVHLGPV